MTTREKGSQILQMKEKNAPGTQRVRQAATPAQKARSSLPWRSLEQQVVRMQKQIMQAAQRGDTRTVHDVQQRLMESEAARLIAVRRAAEENRGKDTAGIDGIKSLSPPERLVMAASIHPTYWDVQPPLPVRRVWVPKPGTNERRPLAILPMIDRCKQVLVKLALEPEWEARFEAHSYGFRPGRSVHDAIAAIVVAIAGRPVFVFNADIEEAFDHVDQTMLLEKLSPSSALRRVITTWLKAGVMDAGTYLPSETGIPQGGALSPLLMNVALHGMEAVVAQGAAGEPPLLVRYADNFVLAHANLHELQRAIRRVRHWLATMGLHLHMEKTRITHTLTPFQGQVGFDFLGFHLHQEPGVSIPVGKRGQGQVPGVKTIIAPSQEAIKRHQVAIDHRLQQWQTAPQARVIAELNPLIVGWVAYYNGMVPAASMRRYDDLLEQRLLKWAGKRHPGKEHAWLLARYWRRIGKRPRVFATPDGVQLRAYEQMSILKG